MNQSSKPSVAGRIAAVAKIVIPILIIAWLVYSVDRRQLSELQGRNVRWSWMILAFAVAFGAICLTFIRWYFLVRALDIPFRFRDSFRLGFLGYFCSFVSVGAVGGDLFKAVFIAREQPGRRMLAVGSVVVDRIMGMYALIIVTAFAMLLGGIPNPTIELQAIRTTTYVAAVVGAIGLAVAMSPGFTTGPLAEMLCGLPKIGGLLSRVIEAIRLYRRQGLRLVALGVMSMSVHLLIALSVHLIATSLYDQAPTLVEHLVIVNLSGVAGALPFTPAGLGTFELAMTTLYEVVPRQAIASGVIVALGYRLVTFAIAAVGVVVYWTSRREMAELQQSLEEQEAAPAEAAAAARY